MPRSINLTKRSLIYIELCVILLLLGGSMLARSYGAGRNVHLMFLIAMFVVIFLGNFLIPRTKDQ